MNPSLPNLGHSAPRTTSVAYLLTFPLALWIAYVFLWYLQFKFTGNPGSVALFTTLTDWLGFPGYEKLMRIGTGSFELAASILLFVPGLRLLGAGLSLGIMSGAIFFHLASPLGIDPYGDGGMLFKEAVATWCVGAAILLLRRDELRARLQRFSATVGVRAAS